MSLNSKIDEFFNKYGEFFDHPTIKYTRQVVHRIKSSPILENFLNENNITSQMLLNEITPYSQYKYTYEGDVKLEVDELQSILDIILFSNEIEKLMIEEHVIFSSIGTMGEIYYIADSFAADYFNVNFGIEVIEDKEFDFTILDKDNNEIDQNYFSLN